MKRSAAEDSDIGGRPPRAVQIADGATVALVALAIWMDPRRAPGPRVRRRSAIFLSPFSLLYVAGSVEVVRHLHVAQAERLARLRDLRASIAARPTLSRRRFALSS